MDEQILAWRNRECLRVSARTLEAYGSELARFSAWGGSAASSAADLDRYLSERQGGGLGASGLGVAVCALRSFFRFAGGSAADGLRLPPVRRRVQRTLSAAELEAVLQAVDTSTVIGKRDVALVGLMVASGLRASEVCRLRLGDLDLARRVLTVVVKGGQMAFGVFDEYAASLLASWLSVRALVAAPTSPTVFVSAGGESRGEALTRVGLKCLCWRLAERAGVAPFTPHALRRTFATLATEYGCPSVLLQEVGRWKDAEMVTLYTQALRLRAFEQFSPLARVMHP